MVGMTQGAREGGAHMISVIASEARQSLVDTTAVCFSSPRFASQ